MFSGRLGQISPGAVSSRYGLPSVAIPDHLVDLREGLQAGEEGHVVAVRQLDQILPVGQRQRIVVGAGGKGFERHQVVGVEAETIQFVARQQFDFALQIGPRRHHRAQVLRAVKAPSAPRKGGPVQHRDARDRGSFAAGLLQQLDECLSAIEQPGIAFRGDEHSAASDVQSVTLIALVLQPFRHLRQGLARPQP